MSQISVSVEAFTGPLDLLLHLIEKNTIDIYDIPIARLTDQYMECVTAFSSENMEQLSEFLVIAATLLEIKSKMLLPSAAKDIEAGVDPREALVARLIEYKRYKGVLDQFKSRENLAVQYVTRLPDEAVIDIMRRDHAPAYDVLLGGVTAQTLFRLFEETLTRKTLATDTVRSGFKSVTMDQYTVNDKMLFMLDMLFVRGRVLFNDLFARDYTKKEKVVTFLALLELVKLKKVAVRQDELFGGILITASEAGDKHGN